MPSWVVPSDSHSPGDTGHTTDHNHVADDLTLIATAFPGVTTGIPSTTQTIAVNKSTTQTTTYSIASSDFCNWACPSPGILTSSPIVAPGFNKTVPVASMVFNRPRTFD